MVAKALALLRQKIDDHEFMQSSTGIYLPFIERSKSSFIAILRFLFLSSFRQGIEILASANLLISDPQPSSSLKLMSQLYTSTLLARSDCRSLATFRHRRETSQWPVCILLPESHVLARCDCNPSHNHNRMPQCRASDRRAPADSLTESKNSSQHNREKKAHRNGYV